MLELRPWYLEAGEQSLREGVEGAAFGLRLVKVELPPEELHAEQSEDDEEEEQEEQQRGDGLHGVEQRRHQIGQSRPVSEETEEDVREEAASGLWKHLDQAVVLTVSP